MRTLLDIRRIGPHPAWQIALGPNHDLVENPVVFDATGAVPPLTYHGGPTIKAPKVVNLIAGTFWSDAAKLASFSKDITENGYLSLGAAQGFGSGAFVGQFMIPAPTSTTLLDSDCQTMIENAIGKNGVPAPDDSTVYMLYLPDGVTVSFSAGGESSCHDFCGYHASTPNVLYTIQPATTCSPCNQGDPWVALCMTASHELAETCSDPRGTGWYNDATGQENADEVAWIQRSYGPWTVQGYAGVVAGQWVNAVGPYVSANNLKPLYDWLGKVGPWEAQYEDEAELRVIVQTILAFDPAAGQTA